MNEVIQFLVLLNPFALFIYLNPLYDELGKKSFLIVLLKATLISGGIYTSFSLMGNFIFYNIFKIRFESFQFFGGVVIFVFALTFIIQGKKSFFVLKGSLDDLASEIALPFMVGAATVAQSIFFGEKYGKLNAVFLIALTLSINYLIITIIIFIKYKLIKKKYRNIFDKNLTILLRVNGFFVGSIGVEMVIKSIEKIINTSGLIR